MKNLVHLFTSYMKLAVISMFLAAICFTFYGGYKTKNEIFFQVTGGGLAALFSFYVIMVFLSLKPSGLARNILGLTAHRIGPRVHMAPAVSMRVSSTLSRAVVAVFVLACNAVALITYAKSRGWPLKTAVWSFSAFSALLLAVILLAVFRSKRSSGQPGLPGYHT